LWNIIIPSRLTVRINETRFLNYNAFITWLRHQETKYSIQTAKTYSRYRYFAVIAKNLFLIFIKIIDSIWVVVTYSHIKEHLCSPQRDLIGTCHNCTRAQRKDNQSTLIHRSPRNKLPKERYKRLLCIIIINKVRNIYKTKLKSVILSQHNNIIKLYITIYFLKHL